MNIIIMHIEQLTELCDFFYSYEEENINNGYNCKNPNCEEIEEIAGGTIGKCYAFSCPLFPQADHDDLKQHDKDLFEEYKNDTDVNDYLVVDLDDLK